MQGHLPEQRGHSVSPHVVEDDRRRRRTTSPGRRDTGQLPAKWWKTTAHVRTKCTGRRTTAQGRTTSPERKDIASSPQVEEDHFRAGGGPPHREEGTTTHSVWRIT